MLVNEKLNNLKNLVQGFSRDEIIWTNGYLAGLLANNQEVVLLENSSIKAAKPTIIYGTETGNAKKLATQLQTLFKKNKIQSKAVDAFQYPIEKIDKEEFIILIVSTQGDGDLPQNAQKFFDHLSNVDLKLSTTKFAVLGLGDTSYPFFCKSGEETEELFLKLGAERVLPLVKADVDYQDVAENWFNDIIKIVQNSSSETIVAQSSSNLSTASHKKNYEGIVKHKVVLNDRGSNKETYHIEIALKEDVDYEPGDALGVYPSNNELEITTLAKLLSEESRANEFKSKNIRALSKKSIQKFSELLGVEIVEDKIDLVDLLEKYATSSQPNFDEVLELLHPIAPRLYSISSSKEAHEDEIHLTVSLNTFDVQNQQKTGLCSQFLADFEIDQSIEFYIHKNKNFKLPEEDRDVIMIGPGTGIAPFRSFLAHRDAIGADGRNWLFFGEQYFVSDFYYQTDIQEWLSTGVLQKLDTAFSRDQKEKIYVQHRVKQQAKEVYQWLKDGAYLYVCGQKDSMSTDVEQTLIEIIANENNFDLDSAKNYLEKLEEEGRYQKDVY